MPSQLEVIIARAQAEPSFRGTIIWYPERVIEQFGLTEAEGQAILTGDFTNIELSDELRAKANQVFDLHDLHSGSNRVMERSIDADAATYLAAGEARLPLAPIWQQLSAALVYEAAGRQGDMAPRIRQMVPGTRCVGRALTVRCPIGDWSAAARAVDLARAGDVLVIDVGGSDRSIGWGGTSSAFCARQGVAGVVTNGAVRDLDEIWELRFPVFATGSCVRGALRAHSGWIGIPVAIGDVVVFPGDVVVGDADGVVVVPQAVEHLVVERAGQLINRGEQIDRDLPTALSYAALTSAPKFDERPFPSPATKDEVVTGS